MDIKVKNEELIIDENFLERYKDYYFTKYSEYDLNRELNTFKTEYKSLQKFFKHFFREVMYDAKTVNSKQTPKEQLQDVDRIKHIVDYINTKPIFYDVNNGIHSNINTYLRFSGLVSQFDPKHVKNIYDYMCKHVEPTSTDNSIFGLDCFNVHDSSCGWGSRMTANLLIGNNYHGTDPNSKLFKQLENARDFIHKTNNNSCDIRCIGSEVFVPEWEGKMDYSFTSPPYFDYEIYTNEETQSINKRAKGKERDDDYKTWLDNFVKPTIDNISRYLRVGGLVGINIANNSKYALYDDWLDIFKQNSKNFVYYDEIVLKWNKTRASATDYSEKVMIFKKV